MPPRKARTSACPCDANGRFLSSSYIATSSVASATPHPSPPNSPTVPPTRPLSPVLDMAGDTGNQEPNPLEMRVIGLESSVNEILDLLRKAVRNPPPPLLPLSLLSQRFQLPWSRHSFKGPPPLIPYVPPPTANTSIGMLSIPDFFPDVDAAIVVSIGKHEFKPQQLGKLIPSVTAKATTTMYALEDGTLRAMDMAPIKDLPDFSTFMCTLGVYFQILYCYAGTPGSIQAVTDVAISTQAYTNLLHEYSHYFSYPAILTYHITHHSCRIREMIRGDYSL
ncbi:hypothetical protein PC9H_002872 [Pleurotus ostreatus]|uniref:Uncharacterized protein n=1 Tax=Pleurotus ostreatus TaxID=5322 RepID=A0A8H7A199_PLEOS|nr:uncharacterized protein PC9H_002872 [Pleurotus ostreatus]KAF7436046.1 hypothetical protein PC9H_002872 [Pleurotus ostreatus]